VFKVLEKLPVILSSNVVPLCPFLFSHLSKLLVSLMLHLFPSFFVVSGSWVSWR
jgi:hypothetical protein